MNKKIVVLISLLCFKGASANPNPNNSRLEEKKKEVTLASLSQCARSLCEQREKQSTKQTTRSSRQTPEKLIKEYGQAALITAAGLAMAIVASKGSSFIRFAGMSFGALWAFTGATGLASKRLIPKHEKIYD